MKTTWDLTFQAQEPDRRGGIHLRKELCIDLCCAEDHFSCYAGQNRTVQPEELFSAAVQNQLDWTLRPLPVSITVQMNTAVSSGRPFWSFADFGLCWFFGSCSESLARSNNLRAAFLHCHSLCQAHGPDFLCLLLIPGHCALWHCCGTQLRLNDSCKVNKGIDNILKSSTNSGITPLLELFVHNEGKGVGRG